MDETIGFAVGSMVCGVQCQRCLALVPLTDSFEPLWANGGGVMSVTCPFCFHFTSYRLVDLRQFVVVNAKMARRGVMEGGDAGRDSPPGAVRRSAVSRPER